MTPKRNAKAAKARAAAQAAVAAVAPAAVEAAVQAASAEQEPTSTYIVVHPVSHDNDDYGRGEEIDLTDDQAQALLALNVIKPKQTEEAK